MMQFVCDANYIVISSNLDKNIFADMLFSYLVEIMFFLI